MIDAEDSDALERQVRELYTERARAATLETLPGLIEEIMGHEHDYGSICVAIGLCAAATAWATNRHPAAQGGVTGFQGSFVFWEFARQWGMIAENGAGVRLQKFDDILYPQNERDFRTISAETMRILQEEAARRIEERSEHAHPAVLAHWGTLASGHPPFGLRIED